MTLYTTNDEEKHHLVATILHGGSGGINANRKILRHHLVATTL
jgi:hypothetical protein